MTDASDALSCDKIAIIGIGCRFPGSASDHRSYWHNLVTGKDCITPTPPDRYDVATLASRDKSKPGKLVAGRGGYIDGFDEFDPAFFGISPREAEHMDPQQRKLLEVAWEALEDGGQKPGELAGTDVAVFVGAFTLDYQALQFADLSFEDLSAHTSTGTMMTILSNRISYCLDFHGPSMSVDTACSSSLVAVHLACQALRTGETSLALAGGTLLHSAPQFTIVETKGGFLSPDGRSRTFDADANGYVRAEGVGLVALKRLDDALADGDPIHGVISATGVNQDGRTNGITVPNPDAQVRLIRRVCAEAGIEPGALQYMEAHGTSTPVGDPIEANALGRALATGREPGAPCYVGSVKTNIGHTESAAGVAGLIKAALALKNKQIPPHINLEQLSPQIDLAQLPFDIPRQLTAWPEHSGPARAGINSFGFGGTNAHVVLEEAPPRPEPPQRPVKPGCTILPLTARDPEQLQARAQQIRDEIRGLDSDAGLRDLAWTLAHRRQHLESRLSVVYDSPQALDTALDAYLQDGAHSHVLVDQVRDPERRGLVWVFTGMGPQWWGMGRQLLDREPAYREAFEQVDREIQRQAGWSLLVETSADEADSRMSETWLAQPANFAVQVALAALWRAHGVQPSAVVGHSTGEVAAFYEAGVYSLEQAVTVVLTRSRLQQRLVGTGTMLAVGLPEADAVQRLAPYGDAISVAAVNSPGSVTLAGDAQALEQLAGQLEQEQVFAKLLAVRVPYHSTQMELIKDELLAGLADLQPLPAQVPLYLTGRPGVAEGPELDAEYWWSNVRDRVHFRAAVDRLADDGYSLFLEIGPHPVLGHSVHECLADRETVTRTVPSIRRGEDEAERFAMSLATLHNLGVAVDWEVLHPAGATVPLPRYPFKRDRYWVEPKVVEAVRLGHRDHPLIGRRLPGAEPTWQAQLDAELLPYLEDHRIQGSVLFPAAGYIEMATQAVRALTGGGTAALADIELRKGLFLSDSEATTVQLALGTEGATFTVASLQRDSSERTVHATGVIRTSQRQRLGSMLDVDRVRERTIRHLTGPACYSALADLGYHYGPAFQAIEEVWIGAGEALARVRPTEALGDDAGRHHLHPVLLDACFQSLLTPQILLADSGTGRTGIRLPLGIGEVRVDPVGDQALWVHATVAREDADELVGDIALYSDDGRPLGRINRFRAADVEKATASVGLSTIDNWLAQPSWEEQPLPLDGEEAGTADGSVGNWLVFADAQGVGDELAALVTARGGRSHLVRQGKAYGTRWDVHESVVEPGSAADLRRLIADLRANGWSSASVAHLWNVDRPRLDDIGAADLAEVTGTGSWSLITLAQALLSEQFPGDLHVVTRGAQGVTDQDEVEPLGASAWGVGRVLRHQELTGHPGRLVDLEPEGGGDVAARRAEAELLLTEARAREVLEVEVALRGGRRFVSRLVPPADLARPLPLRLRTDGAYLVTGAFGALGRLMCRTLVKRGARRIILVGRTPVPERDSWRDVDADSAAGRAVRFLKELEALGAEPVVANLDITDEAGLVAWLSDYRRRESPPIRGVFHLAGQVRDRLLPEMDRATFDTVLRPKVVGAYLLHRHLSDEPLEHFVLFASVASLLTTAGQTNYAAGNAFLDALAHHRRSAGLPALSLDWGPWATGMIEELGLVDHYRNSRGMSSLSPDAGMAVLERVIGQDCPQLVVATVVDWPLFLAWYPSPPPLVTPLAAAAGGARDSDGSSFLDSFREADEDTRRQLVTERFTALAAGVLRVRPEQLDPGVSLSMLGLDSLLAMELRAGVNAELGIALPVMALLSSAPVAHLATQLYDELVELAADESGGGCQASAVELFTDAHRYPLTENQKALWFLKQLHPGGYAYNIGGACGIRVDLDPELLVEAIRILLRRHPLLRANYVMDEGRAVQVISPDPQEDIAIVDVTGEPWEVVYDRIIAEYRKPYDLELDPLVRFRLFRRAADDWVIMKAAHHIISDAISTFTFIEELLAAYEALLAGRTVELPPLTTTYLDFLNWQQRLLAGRSAPKMLEYWRSHLPADIPHLNLPLDKPRPAVQTHNGASELFILDQDLSARVQSMAREHNVTVFMVLLSAYYLLLHRYSGQDDIVVGSPVSGRTQEEFGSVYGYFVNPLPLHVDLAGQPCVAELLEQVRATVLGGLDNQEYPFVLLVDELGLRHDPSRSAVFQAMFILLTHAVSAEKYGYRLDYVDLPEEEGQFDLTLSAYEDQADHRFHCVFKYNTDLFLPATVRLLARHYVNLLDALTRAPSTRAVAELDMLGAEEREVLVEQWSGSGELLRADVPVHRLVSDVARRRPEAIALSAPAASGEPVRVTYAELESRSDAVARGLRAAGLGGHVVSLCMDKSPELVVSLLGVLKAGAAYLCLDPDYPADRLAYMVRNAGSELVVVDDSGWDRLRELTDVRVAQLSDLSGAAAAAAAPPPAGVDLDAPAYVVYTSGSSGQPKAVQVSHANLASAYAAWRAEYRLDEDVRVHLQMASPSFDVFTGDVVRALCSGGTLVLVGRTLLFDTAALYRTMLAERVDCGEFVPAVVRGLMAFCEREGRRLDFLRLLVVGSDAWKVEEYTRLRALTGGSTRVVNSYGVSEATIDSAFFEGPVDGLEPSQMVPIGRPLPNSVLYVLDEQGEPVPPGVPGELWIGGEGVALGYLGDPQQTAERFVSRVLGSSPTAPATRLYRTGDLARWDASGGLHLLGRADGQVKVRGHRVEVGEIESRLAAWPGLSQAVVVVRPDRFGEDTLCAYCVMPSGASLNRRGLRRHLAEYLPTFMIPSHVVEIAELPLTPNGKVDAAALPAPAAEEGREPSEPPTTLFEVRMAAHWQSLLGLPGVGLEDDFFEAGGNSIKLVELVYHLQREFAIDVPVSELFRLTTLRGMAKTVEDVVLGRVGGTQPALRFNPGQGPAVFCFPPAGGHGLVYRQFAACLPDREVVAFNYLVGDDKVERYADLVEAQLPGADWALLGYSLGGNLAFEVAKELERRGHDVPHVIVMDAYRVDEAFELGEDSLEAFERELSEHLLRHTGSEMVAAETREQSRDYLSFSGRMPNRGRITGPLTVISEAGGVARYAPGEPGSWHGSSSTGTVVVEGSGSHAEMLDGEHAVVNAREALAVMDEGVERAA